MKQIQIYRIKNGAGPQVNEQDDSQEHLLPTGITPRRSIHPDQAMELLLPAGVGPAGREEKRDLPPLMDS